MNGNDSAASIAVLGFTILAWASYLPVSKSPALRRTMWPTLLMMALATLASLIRVERDYAARRLDPYSLSALAASALFFAVYFLALRVPVSGKRLAPGARMPPIELPDERGGTFSTRAFEGRGPLLLVFFRGFW